MFEDINKFSAEKIMNGFEDEPARDPVMEKGIDYKDYPDYTDRDIIFRFKDLLPYNEKEINKINSKLNSVAMEYEGENEVCPSCGKHLDLIDNDGHFCKFCGQKLNIDETYSFAKGLKKKSRSLASAS